MVTILGWGTAARGLLATSLLGLMIVTSSAGAQPSRVTDLWRELNAAGVRAYQAGEYDKAASFEEQALALARQAFGSRHPATLTSLNNVGVLYDHQGRYGDAEPLLVEALRLRREVLGSHHPDTLASLDNLAALYKGQGRDGDAEPLYAETLRLHREVLGPRHPDVLDGMSRLAELYVRQGRYGDAKPLYTEALRLRREVLGPRDPATLTNLNNLAGVYELQGRYGDAEPLFVEALRLRREVLGPRDPDTLSSLNNLAGLYAYQLRYGDAEPLYGEALRLFREVLGPGDPNTLGSLNNLAFLYMSAGRYGDAEPLFAEALWRFREVRGPRHPDTLTSLNNLAGVYEHQGRYGDAEPLYTEALRLFREVHGPRHPVTLTSLNNLAMLYRHQGRYSDAEPLFLEALQLRREVLGQGHPDTLVVQLNAVTNYAALRRDEVAVRLLAAMAPMVLDWVGAELYSTENIMTRRKLITSQSTYQDVALNLALVPGGRTDAGELAASAVFQFKGLAADEDAYLAHQSRVSSDYHIRAAADRVRVLRTQRAALSGASGNVQEIEQTARALDSAELELNRMSHSGSPKLQVQKANLSDLRGRLGDRPVRCALLELRQFYTLEFRTMDWGERHWAGILISGDGPARVRDLGPVAESEPKIKTSLVNPLSLAGRAALAALYRQLIVPFEPELAGVDCLYVAPDGMLSLVSFGMLRNGSGQALMDRMDVRLLQSGRDLLRLAEQQPAKGLVAVGGIDFNLSSGTAAQIAPGNPTPIKQAPELRNALPGAESTRVAKTVEQLRNSTAQVFRSGFGPLPQSSKEVAEVARLYRQIRPNELVSVVPTERGPQPTKSWLMALPAPRVLHLATHGFYWAEKEATDRPMLQVGIALAGANRMLQDGGQDGILYALEAQDLNLEGTELVVLSACDTAQGYYDYGDGIAGLVRALRTAGTRRVMVTLGPVDDKSAAMFMGRFYRHWLLDQGGSNDPAAALRKTQREYLVSGVTDLNDRAWASFIIVGN